MTAGAGVVLHLDQRRAARSGEPSLPARFAPAARGGLGAWRDLLLLPCSLTCKNIATQHTHTCCPACWAAGLLGWRWLPLPLPASLHHVATLTSLASQLTPHLIIRPFPHLYTYLQGSMPDLDGLLPRIQGTSQTALPESVPQTTLPNAVPVVPTCTPANMSQIPSVYLCVCVSF